MVLEAHVVLCDRAGFKKKLPQKCGKWGKNSFFLDLFENLVINVFLRFLFEK